MTPSSAVDPLFLLHFPLLFSVSSTTKYSPPPISLSLSSSPNVSSHARHGLRQSRCRTSSPWPAPNRLSLSLSRSAPNSLRHLQLSFAYRLHSGVECELVSEALEHRRPAQHLIASPSETLLKISG
ncbi:hypothetical protein Droror1_Dr00007761 [Drosera rotundifolia]